MGLWGLNNLSLFSAEMSRTPAVGELSVIYECYSRAVKPSAAAPKKKKRERKRKKKEPQLLKIHTSVTHHQQDNEHFSERTVTEIKA